MVNSTTKLPDCDKGCIKPIEDENTYKIKVHWFIATPLEIVEDIDTLLSRAHIATAFKERFLYVYVSPLLKEFLDKPYLNGIPGMPPPGTIKERAECLPGIASMNFPKQINPGDVYVGRYAKPPIIHGIVAEPTCPACPTGYLICGLCDYEKKTKPKPPTLSNTDAYGACACQACDGGMMVCNSCGYSYDAVQGFEECYQF